MAATNLESAKRRTGLIALGVAIAMVGAAYASVPLYRMFCQATGFGGTTGRAAAAPASADLLRVAGHRIKVRFDANVAPDLAWRFRPVATHVNIGIGARQMAYYEAQNLTDKAITGRAVFNVSPDAAGAYFRKIECFCFTEQTLAAGATARMPVTYFIDPAILDDPEAKKIDEITLSYTFYPVPNGTTNTGS